MCEGLKIEVDMAHPRKGEKFNQDAVSYEEALGCTGYGWFQKKATFLCGVVILCSFFGVSAVSYLLPTAQCDLEMDSLRKGTLVSAGFLGIILSCHMWGFLSDTIGRRYVIIRCVFADGVLYILTSFMPYYSLWVIMRFLQGVASCGAVVPAYAYVGEVHTDQYRKKALALAAVIGSTAYIIMPAFAWVVIPFNWKLEIFPWLMYRPWRFFYAAMGIPGILVALALLSVPESPKYLLAKGKEQKAIDALKMIHEQNGSNIPGPFKIKYLLRNDAESVAKQESNTNKVLAFFVLVWKQTAPLFSSLHIKNITLICLTQFLLYFTNNGIILWLPETINRVHTFIDENEGKSATFCYIIQNFDEHKLNKTSDSLNNSSSELLCTDSVGATVYISTLATGCGVTGSLLLLSIIIRYVNQKLAICVCIITSFAMLILTYFTVGTYILIVEMILCILPVASAIPIITNIVIELFPTNIRAMAICLTLLSARIATVMANQVAGFLIDRNCNILLMLYAGAIGVCVIISFILPSKPKSTSEDVKDLHVGIKTIGANAA